MSDAPEKPRMRFSYRLKLFIIFISFALLSNGLLFTILFNHSRYVLFKEIQSEVLSIAATAATLLDGDKHARLKSRADENTPEYRELVAQLRRVRDINRRPGINIANAYTMFITPDGLTRFGVDAEEDEAKKAHFGDVYQELSPDIKEPFNPARLQVTDNVVVDQWGEWVSANAPLLDSKGNLVAAVCMDISLADVSAFSRRLRAGGLVILGISALIAAFASWFLSRHVSGPLYDMKGVVEEVGRGNLDVRLAARRNDEFGDVEEAINGMVRGLKERETIKNAFSRYVSHQLLEELFKDGAVNIKGDRRKVTILFADLVGFSAMAEKLPPEEVVAVLNEYFEAMIDIIFHLGGTLDKFLGDGMMVIFGAPVADERQEENAVRAAVAMQRVLGDISARIADEHGITLRMGIGINTGIAVVGNIGSNKRMEYTAIGDTVNLASRLEAATRQYGAGIIISDYTYVAVRHMVEARDVGSIQVKGREELVHAYALENLKEG